VTQTRKPPEFRPTFEPPGEGPLESTAMIDNADDYIPDLPDIGDVPGLPDDIPGLPAEPEFAPAQPPPMPADPLERPHTREHHAMATVDDDDAPAPTQRPDPRMRQPAPRRKRPTLLPKNLPPAPTARRSSSVMRPVRAREGTSRPGLASTSQESSDVVKTFESGELDARPEPIRPDNMRGDNPRETAAPRRALIRKTGDGRRPQARRQPAGRPQPKPARPPASRTAPSYLPLSAEALSMMIGEQRRRLHILDGFARGLEIAAGVLGTLSLAVLIASLVSILVGTDVSVLNASSALVGSGAAMAITLLMVVAAIALRQMAHVSAQLAALLEALSQRR